MAFSLERLLANLSLTNQESSSEGRKYRSVHYLALEALSKIASEWVWFQKMMLASGEKDEKLSQEIDNFARQNTGLRHKYEKKMKIWSANLFQSERDKMFQSIEWQWRDYFRKVLHHFLNELSPQQRTVGVGGLLFTLTSSMLRQGKRHLPRSRKVIYRRW